MTLVIMTTRGVKVGNILIKKKVFVISKTTIVLMMTLVAKW